MTDIPVLHIDQFLLAQDNGVYVNQLKDHLVSHHNKIATPHRHDFYLTVLFTKGHGTHDVDFVRYQVSPGSVFVLSPGQMHYWQLSDDADGFVMFHSQEFYRLRDNHFEMDTFPFFRSWQSNSEITLAPTSLAVLTGLFEGLLKEKTSDMPLRHLKLHASITLIYIELARLYGLDTGKVLKNRYASIAQDFEKLVDEQFEEVKSPSGYASMLSISSKHLNRVCQRMLGKSATQTITDRVLLEAKRLLITQDATVGEIASMLGYTDYSYFTRLFKKNTGQTPQAFRQAQISEA